jgi:hypothetical protein
MYVYLLIGLNFDGTETIIAGFDSREKAARAMYLYDDSEYDDMWIYELEVQ